MFKRSYRTRRGVRTQVRLKRWDDEHGHTRVALTGEALTRPNETNKAFSTRGAEFRHRGAKLVGERTPRDLPVRLH